MPSPFPGMDPYLEGELWTSFHSQFAAEIARQLAPRLAPRYVALTEKRFVLDTPEDVAIEEIYPDVAVTKSRKSVFPREAAISFTAPLEVATLVTRKTPHFWIEIRDVKKRRLVTAIEFLSPANKVGQDRKDYLRKRPRILLSSAHLVEIDLVRVGRRPPTQTALPRVPYFAFVGRTSKRPIMDVWPIAWHDPLPTIPIPLLKKDVDVPLDLHLALTNVYDLCRYDLVIDYTQPPDIPLPPDVQAWAAKLLRKTGKGS